MCIHHCTLSPPDFSTCEGCMQMLQLGAVSASCARWLVSSHVLPPPGCRCAYSVLWRCACGGTAEQELTGMPPITQ